MVEEIMSVKGVIEKSSMLVLPILHGESKRKEQTQIYCLLLTNYAYIPQKLGGIQNWHIMLMTGMR